MKHSTYAIILVLVGSCLRPSAAARMLRQDPATFTTTRGQQPDGRIALTGEGAEAIASGSSKGVRYNGGRVVGSGDMYPGGRATSITGTRAARSGVPADNNVNLGLEVVAATSQGARAVAGSGVTMTAETGAAITSDEAAFRPGTSVNSGSTAFTDPAATAAATAGQGNGPAALAWGNEVAAFARSGSAEHRLQKFIDSSS